MVSILRITDAFHDGSRQWLAQHLDAGDTLAAPTLLVSEVAGAISRDTGDPEFGRAAIQWLQALPELRLFPMDTSLDTLAADAATELGLRGADAYYVALAIQQGLPLVTWDRQQRERSAKRIAARSPEMLLRQ
jgi:predicted nucleic acid-binding protein